MLFIHLFFFLCCFCLIIGNQAVQLSVHNPKNSCKDNQKRCNTEACCCKWHLGNNVIQGSVGKPCNKDGKSPYRHHFGEEVLHFPEDASLEEKITECIHRGDWSLSAFALYKKGVEENVKITKLYENLFYAMPMGYAEELPKGVYLYFSYEYRLEEGIKLPLYYNILKNFQEGSEIFSHFARPMQDYAISCLLQGCLTMVNVGNNGNITYIFSIL